MDSITENHIKKSELPMKGFSLSVRQLAGGNGGASGQEKAVPEKKLGTWESRNALYETIFLFMKNVFDLIRKQQNFSLEQGFQLVRKIAEVQSPKDPLLIKAIHHDSLENYYIYNCVNTAIYAVKTAENLGWDKERQAEIGMTGLFHDVGMGLVPEELIYKKERLSRTELEIMRNRPVSSYKLLTAYGDDYAWLAESALQIHERADGSGYPKGLQEDDIHEYALVTGLADMYEALIHSRPQGDKYLYFSAMKEIIRVGKTCFNKDHLKSLMNVFSVFPLYSYVRLNSNAIARVIETYPDQPFRPKLRIIYDDRKQKVKSDQIVNLPDNSLLHIVDSVSERELHRLPNP